DLHALDDGGQIMGGGGGGSPTITVGGTSIANEAGASINFDDSGNMQIQTSGGGSIAVGAFTTIDAGGGALFIHGPNVGISDDEPTTLLSVGGSFKAATTGALISVIDSNISIQSTDGGGGDVTITTNTGTVH